MVLAVSHMSTIRAGCRCAGEAIMPAINAGNSNLRSGILYGGRSVAMEIGTTEKGKLGELYVFGKLIEKGAMPFVPVADIQGVDAVVRKKDGTYVEIQIKATWPPEQAGYFNVPDLYVRKDLFIVGLIYANLPGQIEEMPEAWIIPSEVFAANTTKRRLLGLGLGDTEHERSLREKLADYREAWDLLTG